MSQEALPLGGEEPHEFKPGACAWPGCGKWHTNPIHTVAAVATPNDASGRSRADDHSSSRKGAASVRMRAGSQKARLLVAFYKFHFRLKPLADVDAAVTAGLFHQPQTCWWKRCGELRAAGLIAFTGEEVTSPTTGEMVKASRLTGAGLALARTLAQSEAA